MSKLPMAGGGQAGGAGHGRSRELVYAVSGKHVGAFDLASGRCVWATKIKVGWLSGGGIASVAVFGDTLVVGKDGRVIGYDRWTGEFRWENRLEGFGHYATILAGASSDVVAAGAAITASAAATASIAAVTAASG